MDNMKSGILKTLKLYGIGFGLAEISYLTIGHPYIHAPGMHHLILFLTLVSGLIWTFISLIKFYFKIKTPCSLSFFRTPLNSTNNYY
ncbi:hypothetical protein SAMN04489761_0989 [Tenacibaculum sp. MAR_2009_124]|nr:hypothetical protein SAMN04489761_0989 [Tenacibaculum sp. MAR_2009_124]